MLPFSTLGLVALLLSGPSQPSYLLTASELGGRVVVPGLAAPLPSPVPLTVTLYAGPLLVASTPVDLLGRYSVAAPPGDYWLQINIGSREAHAERVLLRAGSWSRDLELDGWLPGAADPPIDVVAEVCGEVRGSGRAVREAGLGVKSIAYGDVGG